DRPTPLFGDRDVLVGHRRGDPERVAVGDEAGQRRDQAAAAAAHGALAVLVELELGGAAVGDDDQRVAVWHVSTLPRRGGREVNAGQTRWSRRPGRVVGLARETTGLRALVVGPAQVRASQRAGPVAGWGSSACAASCF